MSAIPFRSLLIWIFWLVLAIPAWPLVRDLWRQEWYYPELMHISGVWAMQLLVAALLITPSIHLIKHLPSGTTIARWLIKSRRHLGVASFGYASLHLIIYIREQWDLVLILLEALDFEYAVGWISFAGLLLLALTSNDTSVRSLGTRWKKLHWFVYPATALAFLHWLLFDDFTSHVLSWLVPLVVIRTGYMVLQRGRNSRPMRSLDA